MGVGVAHQHDDAAPFAGQKPTRVFVVHAHVVACERTDAREADELEWVEAQVDAAGDDDVEIVIHERGAPVRDREQRRRTRSVDGVPAAGEIEEVADAAGDGV